MSTRDTSPYVEHTDTLPTGQWLHAIHNLTDAQLDMIRGMLREKRSTITTLLHSTPHGTTMHTNLLSSAHELDTLNLHLFPVRQPHHG